MFLGAVRLGASDDWWWALCMGLSLGARGSVVSFLLPRQSFQLPSVFGSCVKALPLLLVYLRFFYISSGTIHV